MNRRQLLAMFGGMAVAGTRAFARRLPARGRVVIAGGGVLGANIAYELARRGAAVTVVEKRGVATGATANSFAWINAKKQPLPYFQLSLMGIEAWRDLHAEIGAELPVRWGGSIEWADSAEHAEMQTRSMRLFQSWGYPVHEIDAARIRTLEPNVAAGSVVAAEHAEIEGGADPVRATEVIMARAVKAGATLLVPAEILGVDAPGGRLRAVKTTEGDVAADVLVIACGVDTPKLASMVGLTIQLTRSPGILFHTAPMAPTVQRVLLSPRGNVKQKPDGRIVTGLDFGPAPVEDATRAKGEAFLQRMAAVVPALGGAALENVTLGFRPMPKDSHPIVGFPEGRTDVYVTVMHSGITLGPLVGRLAALEILDGARVEALAPYRLERFRT